MSAFNMTSSSLINPHQTPLVNLPPPNPKVRAFHRTLPDYAPTPLHSLPELAKTVGVQAVLLKNETLRLGLPAFKILGASWATARAVAKRLNIPEGSDATVEDLKAGAQETDLVLYAATEGNHGRAVARMAKYLGISARIFVPSVSDEAVRLNIESEGAEVVVWDGCYDDAVIGTKEAANSHAGARGLLISDTALVEGEEVAQWMVDGYQTLFDEIEEQAEEFKGSITHVLTPVGVGSLCQAVVTHFKRPERKRNVDVITVEPAEAACLKASLEAGRMTSVNAGYTICSGMCCGTVSANAWPLMKAGVSIATTVEDVQVEKSIFELSKHGVQAGPCGAATTAALKQLSGLKPDAVVVLLCTEGARRYDMVPTH